MWGKGCVPVPPVRARASLGAACAGAAGPGDLGRLGRRRGCRSLLTERGFLIQICISRKEFCAEWAGNR